MSDIIPIAIRMRSADKKEIWDSHRMKPYHALLMGVKSLGNCWTILGDDMPEGMMGVSKASLISNKGIIWLLGTDVLTEDRRLFVKVSKKVFGGMFDGFDYVENHVSTENEISLRWLERLGFNIEEEPVMINDVPFKKFSMEFN
jgi:hypothetical protein